jgi:glycosyltransferase involved in cell wall biosynthesis
MKCCVIIPGYNEEKHIQNVIKDVQKITNNIIVVDDGSSDNTAQLAQELGVIVLQHSVNLGKGAALKTGCDYAYKKGAQNIIVLDADGQHDPQEIPHFLTALENHDIVFGKRRTSKSMPAVFRLGNQGISQILKILYGLKVEDSQCGYRAFTANAYRKMRWTVTDYFMETEMIVKAGKHKLKHTQVSIETIYADKYKGTTVVDGMKIVLKMVGWRFFK